MKYNISDVQMGLKLHGFDPGPIDGIIGRRTIAAVKAFQAARGLDIMYPGTIGPKTIKALFSDDDSELEKTISAPWLEMALTKKGLHEKKDNAELKRFLKADGQTLGDPAKLPWCGDFVETCIALTLPDEPMVVNPYLARNWLKFGDPVEATLGAVGVFWRGQKDGISGHVAFIVGRGNGTYYVLGGNQSNQVSVVPISAARFLGARWPVTAGKPVKPHLPVAKGGVLSINEA